MRAPAVSRPIARFFGGSFVVMNEATESVEPLDSPSAVLQRRVWRSELELRDAGALGCSGRGTARVEAVRPVRVGVVCVIVPCWRRERFDDLADDGQDQRHGLHALRSAIGRGVEQGGERDDRSREGGDPERESGNLGRS
jgi:hypothetical protein